VVGNQVDINAVAVDLGHAVAVVDADASNQGTNSSHCSMTNKVQHQVLHMWGPKAAFSFAQELWRYAPTICGAHGQLRMGSCAFLKQL
jgi:hypothetical protein